MEVYKDNILVRKSLSRSVNGCLTHHLGNRHKAKQERCNAGHSQCLVESDLPKNKKNYYVNQ